MTVHSSGDPVEAVLGHLRAEEPLEQDGGQRALLHQECGVLEEARGDESAAAHEYLAAYNAEPDFREPLEALLRIYGRKRDTKNLPKLLEALVDAARSPAESGRALWELAGFRRSVDADIEQAKSCLEAAVETDPSNATCWLELELVAAKTGDVDTRMKALEARQNLTGDPTWQGCLLIELAELCAAGGDLGRASSLLDTVVALEGRARFRSRLALEGIARNADDPELMAHALEGQAELILQAIEEPELGERAGIGGMMCTAEQAADAWLRAGELRRRAGDPFGAVAALSAAAQRFGDDPLVTRLRMAAAEAAGDRDAAVEIAREQLAQGVAGPEGSVLWLKIAQADDDDGRALLALEKALELDPDNLVAMTQRVDLLATGADPEALARALEVAAMKAGSQRAMAREYVTAAYVWSVRAGDVERGKLALARAEALGMSRERVLRLARSFASMCSDGAWYAEATRSLVNVVADGSEDGADAAAECAMLHFEVARSCLLAGDDTGAVEAFSKLAAATGVDDGTSPSSWLGRALAAYAVGLRHGPHAPRRDHRLVARLAEAEPDRQLARGLVLVAAVLAAREGKTDEALAMASSEHERDPADAVVALFLAGMQRSRGDAAGAARSLALSATSLSDATASAALQLEAGFLLWSAGLSSEAVAAFEAALPQAPEAAQLVLSWALRAARADDLEARRRALDLSEDTDVDRVAATLERFGLAMASRDGVADARLALDRLEDLNPGGDIALATALGRLLLADGGSLELALEQVEQLGGAATQIARTERFRNARFVERDARATVETVRDWVEVEPSLHACLEWLAAAYAADDKDEEIRAREALAEHLPDGAAASVRAAAALMRAVHRPAEQAAFVKSSTVAARLCNLELAPPGSEPSRRAASLKALGDAALGEQAGSIAERLSAWSDLASGANTQAQDTFRRLVKADPEDLTAWEGLRAASERIGDWEAVGVALAQLGNHCEDDARAGALWERAGLVLLEHTEAHDDAEIALQRALERDSSRFDAFDKLFRRVRDRNDDGRLLELIDLRLSVTDKTPEITKMYWERARVLRRRGDQEGALQCLKDVTMLEPDHVGALALAGEISIHRGEFAEAAPLLARLAKLAAAPQKQRLLSAIAAVDLYEKKLGQADKALEVLSQLYKDGLSTMKVRERLARTAARVGNWEEAASILERLMEEREDAKGRGEAARLAMVIYRDKLKKPERAGKAVKRLLDEVTDDKEGIQLLLRSHVSDELKRHAVPRAKQTLLTNLTADPFDRDRVELLAEIADEQGDFNLRRAALGVALALGSTGEAVTRAVANLDSRAVQEPQIVLDTQAILAICDRDDQGPVPELFAQIAPIVSEALGPSLKSEDVGRRNRVDGGDLRIEISRWMGAVGFGDFELYVGGRDPKGVKGVAGDRPALVVGPAITVPLDAGGRSALAREVFALRRGTTSVMYCDDHTIASIVAASVLDAGVAIPEPPFAVYREVERLVKKAMSRRVRKAITDICERIALGASRAGGQDPLAWAEAARRSIDRMALIASGDASSVIEHIAGPPGSAGREEMTGNTRARRLLQFALSTEYRELRAQLGMGIG